MALHLATAVVMGQKSAEAIVGDGRCRPRSGNWKQAGEEPRKPYPAEGLNEEEGRRLNELVRHNEPEWGNACAARH